jgi:putative transposase
VDRPADRLDRFVICCDPRAISRIWVLDPDGGAYLEVPYPVLSRPPISVWEHKAAVARLREQGRAEVDEPWSQVTGDYDAAREALRGPPVP